MKTEEKRSARHNFKAIISGQFKNYLKSSNKSFHNEIGPEMCNVLRIWPYMCYLMKAAGMNCHSTARCKSLYISCSELWRKCKTIGAYYFKWVCKINIFQELHVLQNCFCILGHNIQAFNRVGQGDRDIHLVCAEAEFNMHHSRAQPYGDDFLGFALLYFKQRKNERVNIEIK